MMDQDAEMDVPHLDDYSWWCNAFNKKDCVAVMNKKMHVNLSYGEPKLYLPMDSEFFQKYDELQKEFDAAEQYQQFLQ